MDKINNNKIRHELLGLLAKEYADGQGPQGSIIDIILSVPTILKKLNIGFDEFIIMSEELIAKKEIEYFNHDGYNDSPALYVLSDGITAFANKRYLRAATEKRREDIKFWAQLILPVLSFIIAAYALYLNTKTQTEIESVKESQKIESTK